LPRRRQLSGPPAPRMHGAARALAKTRTVGGQTRARSQSVSGRDQAPTNGDSWAGRAADKNVVVQIPDRRLTRAGIVKDVIGSAIVVEVRRGC
jgi:hypothetical protein